MKALLRILSCLLVTSTLVFAAKSRWHMAEGPLMTKWSADVDDRHPWPEYPRPQMERKSWMNLNGQWDYAILEKKNGVQGPFEGKILVPYPIESALSGVMKRVGENQVLVYHRTFRLPGSWKNERVLLHFGAVDWETVVVVNGHRVGEHRGGYDPFTFDITDALTQNRDQDIEVSVFDPSDSGGQPRGKQVNKPNGIWYTPSSGIWQTVWLEPVPQSHIADFKITPDVEAQALRVSVNTTGGDLVEAIAYSHGHEVGARRAIPVKNLLCACRIRGCGRQKTRTFTI